LLLKQDSGRVVLKYSGVRDRLHLPEENEKEKEIEKKEKVAAAPE
jgi:hypothetical protein